MNDINIRYIKLSDFGLSAILKENERCQSFSGTAQYLPPEIIEKKGHDKSADVWSFGILVFVLITFEFPFSAKNNNNKRLFDKIKKCKIKWEKFTLSDTSRSLLQAVRISSFSNFKIITLYDLNHIIMMILFEN